MMLTAVEIPLSPLSLTEGFRRKHDSLHQKSITFLHGLKESGAMLESILC